jgi:hypothetical protein
MLAVSETGKGWRGSNARSDLLWMVNGTRTGLYALCQAFAAKVSNADASGSLLLDAWL